MVWIRLGSGKRICSCPVAIFSIRACVAQVLCSSCNCPHSSASCLANCCSFSSSTNSLRALCCEVTTLSAQAMRIKVNKIFILITPTSHQPKTRNEIPLSSVYPLRHAHYRAAGARSAFDLRHAGPYHLPNHLQICPAETPHLVGAQRQVLRQFVGIRSFTYETLHYSIFQRVKTDDDQPATR